MFHGWYVWNVVSDTPLWNPTITTFFKADAFLRPTLSGRYKGHGQDFYHNAQCLSVVQLNMMLTMPFNCV